MRLARYIQILYVSRHHCPPGDREAAVGFYLTFFICHIKQSLAIIPKFSIKRRVRFLLFGLAVGRLALAVLQQLLVLLNGAIFMFGGEHLLLFGRLFLIIAGGGFAALRFLNFVAHAFPQPRSCQNLADLGAL